MLSNVLLQPMLVKDQVKLWLLLGAGVQLRKLQSYFFNLSIVVLLEKKKQNYGVVLCQKIMTSWRCESNEREVGVGTCHISKAVGVYCPFILT